MKQGKFQLKQLAKGVALSAVMTGVAVPAFAGFQGHLPGPVATLGKVSDPNTLLSWSNNPAAGELLIAPDEDFRMGYWSSFGLGYEVGDLNNVSDDIDELEELLEDDPANPMTLDRALTAKEKFDDLLPELGEKMNLALDMGVHVPLFPMAFRSETLGGVIGVDVRTSLLADVIFLDAPLDLQNNGGEVTLSTESALYVKAANLTTGSISYSREVWQPPAFDSKIYAGFSINAYHAKLNKQVVSFEAIAEDSDDMSDAIQDEFEENLGSSTAVGVDLGVVWSFPNAQAGLTISNINEPEFDYGEIGNNCGALTDGSTRQKNCLAALAFSDEIDLKETAVLTAQTTLEGAIYTEDRMFGFSGAYDLNSAYNVVGRESQMLSAALTLFPNSYFIPAARLGIQKNLVGSELTTLSAGFTFMGTMNLDFAFSPETVEDDGDKIPRSAGFRLGFEEKF